MDRTRRHNQKRNWKEKERESRREADGNAEAIHAFKMIPRECPLCKKPLVEVASALADKETGEPVHFDCVLEKLQAEEKLMPGQKISYIGQGRFAVLYFPNAHDNRNFTIERIIEWEKRDARYEWRTEMAGLYSQVK